MAFDDFRNEVKNDPALGKSMAKWGALGAVIAIPLPFVGPIIGAAAGAGYAYFKRNKQA
ncbi:hypothetical protein [Sphingomonas oligophenolica]|uniref:hypothetical protein n=1 Tax=Sphingomonas oligophenolica TaxID=301154 RepID=UPI0014772E99|nr:hypothetical protein [Sphingomonas oligophenolica]